MFVNCLSEIDFTLSQVNVLLSEVNSKLELCSAESRKLVLSRLSNILSEMMWAVSLSADEGSGSECDVSSYSADVESLAWDSSEDFYKIYYDDEEGDDHDERVFEDDDHGPMDSSIDTSPDIEDVKVESLLERYEKSPFDISVTKCPADPDMVILTPVPRKLVPPETGPPLPVSSSEDDDDLIEGRDVKNENATFVKEMLVKINLLAPEGEYKVVRPIKYSIDFTRVNQFFMRNIPTPKSFPIQGCSQDPSFYDRELAGRDRDGSYVNSLPNHYKDYPRPHGYLYGYETDIGIVPVPDEAVNGYVWKDGSWILHAIADDGVNSRFPSFKKRGFGG